MVLKYLLTNMPVEVGIEDVANTEGVAHPATLYVMGAKVVMIPDSYRVL